VEYVVPTQVVGRNKISIRFPESTEPIQKLMHSKIETFHYPKTITARKHDYLCGIGGKYFADKKLANNCNNSHIMG
jgi:hypothetical protein